ncbi:MAG: hypothetical protein AAF518_25585 [Spirochaetota bacterium]
MHHSKKISVLLALTLLPFLSFAETIIMKTGKVVYGKVVDHDSDSVVIQDAGVRKTIAKENVYKIIYSTNKKEVRNIIAKEKLQIARSQRKLALEKRKKRKDRQSQSSQSKKQTNASLSRLNQKIEKLEQKITKLRSKIQHLKKNLKSPKKKSNPEA